MARSRRQKGALHTRGSRHHKDSSHTAIIAIVALVAVIGLALLSFSIFAPMRNLSGQATELVTLEADLLDARTNELEEAVDLSTYSADTQEALFDVTIAIKEISPEYSETGEVSEYTTIITALDAALQQPEIMGTRGLWQALASTKRSLERAGFSDREQVRGLLNAVKLIKKAICEAPYAPSSANNPRVC